MHAISICDNSISRKIKKKEEKGYTFKEKTFQSDI